MKVKQMADILNDVFIPEATGVRSDDGTEVQPEPIFSDDLSVVGTLGERVTINSEYGNNMNAALKTIFDKVGQTLYRDETFTSGGFDIQATDAEYGSILEKIRVEAPDFDINKSWSFKEGECSSHEEMFGLHLTETDAKYFNATSTFATKPYSVFDRQLKSAFTTKEKIVRFFSAVEARAISKRNLAINLLTHKAVVGLLVEKIKSGKNVYKLLNEYRAATGDASVNKTNWRVHKPFLVWVSVFVNTIYDIMYEPTGLFNEDEYISQTTDENRKFYMISDLSRALEAYVYRDSFNKDEGKIRNYKTIAFWQSVGLKGEYETRSSIKAIPISEGEPPISGEDDRQVIEVTGVLGTIFNKWGCCVNAKQMYSSAVPNEDNGWTNYRHKFDAGYFIDTGENAVVFLIGDDPVTISPESNDVTYPWTDKTADDMQSNIVIVDNYVFGTLKYIENGLAQTGPLSGSGNFIAIHVDNVPSDATTYIGLTNSQSSGLVPLDSDSNAVLKITDKTTQKIIISVKYNNGNEEKREFSLANLVLETQ